MSTYIKNQSLLLIWNRINNRPLKFIFIREELSAQTYWYFRSVDGNYLSINAYPFRRVAATPVAAITAALLEEIQMKINRTYSRKEGYFPESFVEAGMFPENPINMIVCCGE
jgi:hypothetical protein